MIHFWKKKAAGLTFPIYDKTGTNSAFHVTAEFYPDNDASDQALQMPNVPVVFAQLTLRGKGEELIAGGIRYLDAETGEIAEAIRIKRQGVVYAIIEERFNRFHFREYMVYDGLQDTKEVADSMAIFRVTAGFLRWPKLTFLRGDRKVAKVWRHRLYGDFFWGMEIEEDQDEKLVLAVTLAIETIWKGIR